MEGRLGLTVPLEGLSVAETVVPLARLAEDSGYTDLWSAEVSGADGLTPLAAAATSTTRLRLGTAILPVFTRSPALLAMSAASLQSLSGGRFVLGLGASTPAIVEGWMGESFESPLARMRETVALLRQALDGKRTDFAGETTRSSGFRLSADPGAPVPIYLAALGPLLLRLAGEIADGVVLFLVTPQGAADAVARVKAAAEAAGRDPGSIDVVARIGVALGEDEETLRFMLRRVTTPYAIADAYNRSLARQGFGREAGAIAGRWKSGDREGANAAVSDELLEAFYVFGDASECRRRIEEFREAGVKIPVVLPISVAGDPAERLERIREAIPLLAG